MASALGNANVDWPALDVQEHWNCLETILIKCVDECVPLVNVTYVLNTKNVPSIIRNKINVRKRLLKSDRENSSSVNAPRIKTLNKELNSFWRSAKTSRVRRVAAGGKFNLWNASSHDGLVG